LFFPQQGAIIGQILGTVFPGWVAVGSLIYGKPFSFLPTSTDLCVEASSFNTTGTFITQDNVTTLATTEAVGTTPAR